MGRRATENKFMWPFAVRGFSLCIYHSDISKMNWELILQHVMASFLQSSVDIFALIKIVGLVASSLLPCVGKFTNCWYRKSESGNFFAI